MKLTIIKKELESYMEVVETSLGGLVDEPTMSIMKVQFMEQVKAGIKEGAVKVGFNKKMNLTYEIDEKFVCKIMSMYSKYLAVVIPQVMSIYNLTKNLIEDTMDVAMDFEDEKEDPECKCGKCCGKED